MANRWLSVHFVSVNSRDRTILIQINCTNRAIAPEFLLTKKITLLRVKELCLCHSLHYINDTSNPVGFWCAIMYFQLVEAKIQADPRARPLLRLEGELFLLGLLRKHLENHQNL